MNHRPLDDEGAAPVLELGLRVREVKGSKGDEEEGFDLKQGKSVASVSKKEKE